jgi:hypothetical protein
LTGCDAKAGDQKVYKLPSVRDVNTVLFVSKEIPLKGRAVHYTLLYESSKGAPRPDLYKSHNPSYVEEMIKESSYLMNAFLTERGIKPTECRGRKYNIIIMLVSRIVLEDKARFQEFYRMKYGEDRKGPTLLGFYDSTPAIENNSSIILTDVGPYLNGQIFAHELAHYWWDRLCLPNQISGSSESFAQAFEAYYVRRQQNDR